MEKKKILKWLFPFTLGCVVSLGGLVGDNLIIKADEGYGATMPIIISTSTQHDEVTINDENLARILRVILGKSENAKLYTDDFLTNANFKPVTDDDGNTSAPTYQLDLSDTGITNILELSKFIFPETLNGINLSGNGITNEHLENITTLLNATESSQIILDGDENPITPACNFSSIIKKVNLNNNKINLDQTSSTYLNNTKLIFGIQNFGIIDDSGFVKSGEMIPMYYIRDDDDGSKSIICDEHYISMAISFEYSVINNDKNEGTSGSTSTSSLVRLTYNKPTSLLDFNSLNTGSTYKYGKVSLSVNATPHSDSSYFSGYAFSKEFILFDISFDSSFWVERGNLLDLHLSNGQLTSDSKLTIEGFGKSLSIAYDNPSTNRITTDDFKNLVNITLSYKGKSRTVPVEFFVQDTIDPVIKLIGSDYVYCSRNKNYNDIDPGVIAYDPVTVGGARTEENALEYRVVKTKDPSNYNYSELGTYKIIYTVKDDAGRKASVERTVEIQERVLDTINLRCNTDTTIIGDDITFVVQPDSDIVMSNYQNVTYEWYINDVLQQTTKGDATTGKSTTTLSFSQIGNATVRVKIKAKQIVDDAHIEFYSNTLTLDIQPKLRNGSTLILGTSIAIVIVLMIIGLWAINNRRKSRNTSGKHKNFHKGKAKKDKYQSSDTQPQIQVIKNYNGTGTSGNNGGNGEGGGNSNFRPPENNDRSL